MAVQAYVGTLTRFFSYDWETEAQRDAHRTGETVVVVTTDGQPVQLGDPKAIEPQITEWRAYVAKGAAGAGAELHWPEGMGPPYFTLGLSWDALAALYLWAAYAQTPEAQFPERVDDWANDDVFLTQAANKALSPLAVLLCGFWLPSAGTFRMECAHPAEGRTTVVSLPMLRDALEQLNACTWRASPAEIAQWRSLYGGDTGGLLDPAARYAFSVFWDLAATAQREGLPMTLRF